MNTPSALDKPLSADLGSVRHGIQHFMGLSLECPSTIFPPSYSTFAFLSALNEHPDWWRHAQSVLDVGCGSGVLGLWVGKQLDASLTLLDISPECCLAARANAERNKVKASIVLSDFSSLLRLEFPVDLLLANLPLDSSEQPEGQTWDIALIDPGYELTRRFFLETRELLASNGGMIFCASPTLGNEGLLQCIMTESGVCVIDSHSFLLKAPTPKHPSKVHRYTVFLLKHDTCPPLS